MEITIGSYKIRVWIVILSIVVFWIMFGHLLCSCCTTSFSSIFNRVKEGFRGNNVAYGPEYAPYKLNDYSVPNTSHWSNPTLTFSKGKKPDQGVESIWHRKPQAIPLPEGELNMFETTPFKPECCPNTYSNSMGCACMTVPQYNYLRDRGGNNVPYSEY